MKTPASLALALLAALTMAVHAADTKITGEAMCAKCELQEVSACQMAIKVKGANGKEEVIMADNNRSRKIFTTRFARKMRA